MSLEIKNYPWSAQQLNQRWEVVINAAQLRETDLKRLPPSLACLFPLTGNHRLPRQPNLSTEEEKLLQAKQAEVDAKILQTLDKIYYLPDRAIQNTQKYHALKETNSPKEALERLKKENRQWLQNFSLDFIPKLLADSSGSLKQVFMDMTRTYPDSQLLLYNCATKSALGFCGMQGVSEDQEARAIFEKYYLQALEEKFGRNKLITEIATKKFHQGSFVGGLMTPLQYYLQTLCDNQVAKLFPQTTVFVAESYPREATLIQTYPIRSQTNINEYPIIYTLFFRVSKGNVSLETIKLEIIPDASPSLYYSHLKKIPGFDFANLTPSNLGLSPDICQISKREFSPDEMSSLSDYLNAKSVPLCSWLESKVTLQPLELNPNLCQLINFNGLILKRELQELLQLLANPKKCLEKIVQITAGPETRSNEDKWCQKALPILLHSIFSETSEGIKSEIKENDLTESPEARKLLIVGLTDLAAAEFPRAALALCQLGEYLSDRGSKALSEYLSDGDRKAHGLAFYRELNCFDDGLACFEASATFGCIRGQYFYTTRMLSRDLFLGSFGCKILDIENLKKLIALDYFCCEDEKDSELHGTYAQRLLAQFYQTVKNQDISHFMRLIFCFELTGPPYPPLVAKPKDNTYWLSWGVESLNAWELLLQKKFRLSTELVEVFAECPFDVLVASEKEKESFYTKRAELLRKTKPHGFAPFAAEFYLGQNYEQREHKFAAFSVCYYWRSSESGYPRAKLRLAEIFESGIYTKQLRHFAAMSKTQFLSETKLAVYPSELPIVAKLSVTRPNLIARQLIQDAADWFNFAPAKFKLWQLEKDRNFFSALPYLISAREGLQKMLYAYKFEIENFPFYEIYKQAGKDLAGLLTANTHLTVEQLTLISEFIEKTTFGSTSDAISWREFANYCAEHAGCINVSTIDLRNLMRQLTAVPKKEFIPLHQRSTNRLTLGGYFGTHGFPITIHESEYKDSYSLYHRIKKDHHYGPWDDDTTSNALLNCFVALNDAESLIRMGKYFYAQLLNFDIVIACYYQAMLLGESSAAKLLFDLGNELTKKELLGEAFNGLEHLLRHSATHSGNVSLYLQTIYQLAGTVLRPYVAEGFTDDYNQLPLNISAFEQDQYEKALKSGLDFANQVKKRNETLLVSQRCLEKVLEYGEGNSCLSLAQLAFAYKGLAFLYALPNTPIVEPTDNKQYQARNTQLITRFRYKMYCCFGAAYENGSGIARDLVKAKKYFNHAKSLASAETDIKFVNEKLERLSQLEMFRVKIVSVISAQSTAISTSSVTSDLPTAKC